MSNKIIIGNCSGFYGDRLSAAKDMVDGGPLDILTGDYLAELTMTILYGQKMKRGDEHGYVGTFLKQFKEIATTCQEKNIKVVTNAGGLNPESMAQKIEEIIYIRSVVESASKSMGSLPGEVEEKFLPWSLPLLEKLNELLDKPAINNLMTEGYVKCVPVNYTRGLTFKNACVVIDESQNLTREELTTILTRFGENSKYIVVGDTQQSDIGNKSGFKAIFNAEV